MDTWIVRKWGWLFGGISAFALLLKEYAKRHDSVLGREIPFPPDRALIICGGIFTVVMCAGILIKSGPDEVVPGALGIGVLLIAAGIFGRGRFASWLLGGLAVAGLIRSGIGVIRGH